MAEVNVTRLVTEAELSDLSASRAERGDNAGPETWANAKQEAGARPLMTDDERNEFRDYTRGFGAWEDDEIDAWSGVECDALLAQMVAGDMRELESLCPGDGVAGIDWDEARRLVEAGTVSGRIYASGDEVFFCVGN